MAERSVLDACGVSKCYDPRHPEVLALDDVEVSVLAGEMVAVTGPSGCGKSTLLHLLGGLDRPTRGHVLLDGRRIDDLSEAKRARLRRQQIGYLFQFFNLITNLSVADNVELPMLLVGRSPRDARSRRTALLERLGVADSAGRSPAELSGGQQQRVALARAVANEPAVLLADEPTGNLDSAATNEVLALLHEQHDHGQTIVLVTHDMRVAGTADRVLEMEDGHVRGGHRSFPELQEV